MKHHTNVPWARRSMCKLQNLSETENLKIWIVKKINWGWGGLIHLILDISIPGPLVSHSIWEYFGLKPPVAKHNYLKLNEGDNESNPEFWVILYPTSILEHQTNAPWVRWCMCQCQSRSETENLKFRKRLMQRDLIFS